MNTPNKRPREGIVREDAGTTDVEGFLAPSIGAMEHALYFTTAPSVADKAVQAVDEGRLRLPGVVVVWDETVGRRKGSKAVPNAWWAGSGSLTAAFAFPASPVGLPLGRVAAAVTRAIESFQPTIPVTFRPPNDLLLGDKKVGALSTQSAKGVDLAIVRLNCSTDLSKAPAAIVVQAGRLVDVIDVQQLPLQQPGTLTNTLLTRLMAELPREFGRA